MTTTASSQSGLFAQLEPLLAHRAVLITVSKLDGDQLQVNICPRSSKVRIRRSQFRCLSPAQPPNWIRILCPRFPASWPPISA
jgi:hypothetical protein